MTEYSKTHGQIIDKIIYLQFVEPALFELLEDKMPRKDKLDGQNTRRGKCHQIARKIAQLLN